MYIFRCAVLTHIDGSVSILMFFDGFTTTALFTGSLSLLLTVTSVYKLCASFRGHQLM